MTESTKDKFVNTEFKKSAKALKKEKQEKSMKKTIIVTVVTTLAVVLAFAGTFMAGVNYQKSYEAGIAQAVNDKVADLKASVKR